MISSGCNGGGVKILSSLVFYVRRIGFKTVGRCIKYIERC